MKKHEWNAIKGDLYDTDRFLDIKLSCREQMLQKLMDYDPAKGAKYATYIFPFIRDAMLRFRMGEEKHGYITLVITRHKTICMLNLLNIVIGYQILM